MDVTDKTYAVVDFTNEGRRGQKVIDLVPTCWLTQNNKKWNCSYPPKKGNNIADLVKEGKAPSSSWKQHEVLIVQYARSYEQGIRRMERAIPDMNVESTQAEDSTVSDEEKQKIGTNLDDGNESEEVSSSVGTPTKPDTVKKTVNKKRKLTKCENCFDGKILQQVIARLDESDKRHEKAFEKLEAQIQKAKKSILYDVKEQASNIQDTITINQGSNTRESLKNHKDSVGIKMPLTTLDEFLNFDTIIEADAKKSGSLKAIMANDMGAASEPKDAVRRILGQILKKSVQEKYSGAGRKGPNGITKMNFSATHVYSCMQDVIKDKNENIDSKAILSATSRYLSGAGDREGGKAARDAKKQNE